MPYIILYVNGLGNLTIKEDGKNSDNCKVESSVLSEMYGFCFCKLMGGTTSPISFILFLVRVARLELIFKTKSLRPHLGVTQRGTKAENSRK